ncbi:hypothetical protein [Jiangella endophytica]|uniref:hypothetical protein n=1 Tax=Jiangella endophytica TaxID=1623398 RepID=UPI001300A116|nr:hypothetical protein [Jiangella endophytica]
MDGYFGWLGRFLRVDGPASSARTRDRFGWQPVQPGLLADLDAGHYVRDRADVSRAPVTLRT